VNIYLIPYTGMRHVVLGLTLAAAGLLGWWGVSCFVLVVQPLLHDRLGTMTSRPMDGVLYVGTLVVIASAGSLLGEGSLRRRALAWRFFWALSAAFLSVLVLMSTWGVVRLLTPLFTGEQTDALLQDPSLVTLRFRIAVWLAAGFASGFGPFVIRQVHAGLTRRFPWGGRDASGPPAEASWLDLALSLFAHLGGGTAAGAFAAIAWYVPGYYGSLQGDLYIASALAAATFGGVHGLLVWPIPEDLYAGWIRVLSYERYGLRIPVPHSDGSPAERFVGHFPRGLDLYLPAERGVAELHVSFVLTNDRYTVRGLSVQPILVKRLLERIDLRYDPRRPAPLETALGMEDRILLGPDGETEIEFLMLPREER
jgi:hypothetical protein